MNGKLQIALDAIRIRESAFKKAEEEAIDVLKLILERTGEHGVSTAPLDDVSDIYVPIAECEPQEFKPITLIRYWKEKLEVFISEIDDEWNILPDGRWVDYESAHTDTWFMLDVIAENIEYADGYDD